MSSTLPSSQDCCATCNDPILVNVPGPPADAPENGTNGTNGLDAFSLIDGGDSEVPAWQATSSIALQSPPGSQWIAIGQVIYIQSYGYFRVDALTDNLHATIFNLGDGTNYPNNANGGGNFTSGVKVSPGGVQGPGGAVAGDALLTANNLSDLVDAPTARANLGLGSAALKATGLADGQLPAVDDITGLTNGEALFATASGIQSIAAALARAALGLLSMSLQAASAVAITGGTVAGITDLAVADGGTGASTAAAARANLGVGVLSVLTKTVAYPITTADDVILADATTLSFSVLLPLAATSAGKRLAVIKIDAGANTVTLDGNGANINGAGTKVLTTQWDSADLVCNGTAWYLI